MSLTSDERRKIEGYFHALETKSKHITKWEEQFVASLRVQFDKHNKLSEKQLDILERIYAEKTEL